MAIEVDFIGVPNVKDDYDAIAFRILDNGRLLNCVFDGGTSVVGDALVEHLRKYYGKITGSLPKLDYVFCSHGDRDHSAGLATLLKTVRVENVIINFPWDVLDELYERRKNRSLTKEGLLKQLRRNYPELAELDDIVKAKKINRISGFVEDFCIDGFSLLSPLRKFYVDKIAESDKSPGMIVEAADEAFHGSGEEGWETAVKYKDSLRNEVSTTPENETSLVLYVEGGGNPVLLTGDAGVESLGCAVQVANTLGVDFGRLQIVQVPHHGGRHNVTSSILDEILGPVQFVSEEDYKWAFVSVGNGSDHPKRCVTNAFWNRGWNVYVSSKGSLHGVKGSGFPKRNWESQAPIGFSSRVEKWD